MSTSVLQRQANIVAYNAQQRLLGTAFANTLGRVAPPTTTNSFTNYAFNNYRNISTFFTHSIPNTIQKPFTTMKILIIVLIVVAIIYGIIRFKEYVSNIETYVNKDDSDNVKEKKEQRLREIKNIVEQLKTVTNQPTQVEQPEKQLELDEAQKDYPSLINLQLLTPKQSAFLGPLLKNDKIPDAKFNNGIFDELEGIRYQLEIGIRSFFFQIDYVESNSLNKDKFSGPFEPMLLYRDYSNYLNSYNSAKIDLLFDAINKFAFNDSLDTYEKDKPVFVYLHFVRVPYGNISEKMKRKEYLSTVARSINSNYLLTGGYYRSKNEEGLFNKKVNDSDIKQKIILGTNIDTSIFKDISGTNINDDLDYKVNFHYYIKDSNNMVDATSILTERVVKPMAFIYSIDTLIEIDKDPIKKDNWIIENKGKFIIIKTASDKNVSTETMETLLNEYGVNIVCYDFFSENIDESKKIKKIYGKGYKRKPIF